MPEDGVALAIVGDFAQDVASRGPEGGCGVRSVGHAVVRTVAVFWRYGEVVIGGPELPLGEPRGLSPAEEWLPFGLGLKEGPVELVSLEGVAPSGVPVREPLGTRSVASEPANVLEGRKGGDRD